MKTTTLRGTDLNVSRACLGTMTFGGQTNVTESGHILDHALDVGVNFIDTANSYTGGQSESILGELLSQNGRRDRTIIATKVFNHVTGDPAEDRGLGRANLAKSVEASLRRLQTDTIDLLYLHCPDRSVPIEETLRAVDALVKAGKVRHLGMSNYASWQMADARHTAITHDLVQPAVTQIPYNIITRAVDEECAEFVATHGFGVTVYNPIAAGLLTGKHRVGAPETDTRFQQSEVYYERYWHPGNFRAVERLSEIAQDLGISLIEMAMRWVYSQPIVDSVIIGASRPAQIEQSLAVPDEPLDATTLKMCDAIWADLRGPHFKYNR
jgi:1-deoxyxylulose-5-phosphate synthase